MGSGFQVGQDHIREIAVVSLGLNELCELCLDIAINSF